MRGSGNSQVERRRSRGGSAPGNSSSRSTDLPGHKPTRVGPSAYRRPELAPSTTGCNRPGPTTNPSVIPDTAQSLHGRRHREGGRERRDQHPGDERPVRRHHKSRRGHGRITHRLENGRLRPVRPGRTFGSSGPGSPGCTASSPSRSTYSPRPSWCALDDPSTLSNAGEA